MSPICVHVKSQVLHNYSPLIRRSAHILHHLFHYLQFYAPLLLHSSITSGSILTCSTNVFHYTLLTSHTELTSWSFWLLFSDFLHSLALFCLHLFTNCKFHVSTECCVVQASASRITTQQLSGQCVKSLKKKQFNCVYRGRQVRD